MVRKMFGKIYEHIEKKPYSILIGARQTGKTTILKQLYDRLRKEGKAVYFFDLERKDLQAELNNDPQNLLRYLENTDKRKYVFIDEIQYLNDPSNFLKLFYDEYADRIKIIATGSSAFYIDKKFNDSLAGRKRLFYLDTCSFEEYLELKGETELLKEYKRLITEPEAKSMRLIELNVLLEDYIIYGGYPAVACESDNHEKIRLLKELRDSYLQCDIDEAGVQNSDAFYKLFVCLAAQSGSEVNISELAKTIGVSIETITNYLIILQKSFHIALVAPFYRNLKKELVKMKKVYILDTGMRNCLINYYPEKLGVSDDGALFENYVYHRLREHFDSDEIHYWRTADQKEVDFVIDAPQMKRAYEVKFNSVSIKESKYNVFRQAYPAYTLSFVSHLPVSEERFREIVRAEQAVSAATV